MCIQIGIYILINDVIGFESSIFRLRDAMLRETLNI